MSTTSTARLIRPSTEGANLQVQVKPNPSAENADQTVSGMTGYAMITVTNILGQTVYSSNVTVDTTTPVLLPIQLWETGTYMVVVTAGGKTTAERLVVE